MVSLQVAYLAMIVSNSPEAVLLDFQADWCGSCRQMEPVVERLAQRGYPLRRVDVDDDRQLAEQFQVRGIPCFVLLVDGREVDRAVGAMSLVRLERMFHRAGFHPLAPASQEPRRNQRRLANARQAPLARAQSPDTSVVPVVMPSSRSPQPLGTSPGGGVVSRELVPRWPSSQTVAGAVGTELAEAPRWQGALTQPTVPGQSPAPLGRPIDSSREPHARLPRGPAGMPGATTLSRDAADVVDRLIQASVRIRIEDNEGRSVGSGTIIDAHDGEALVVTCGHIFREHRAGGCIEVDLFGPGAPRTVQGRLISHDLTSDVGLVGIRTDGPVTSARLAPRHYAVRVGHSVINIGCNHGADPTARQSQITSIDKFVGPPNLQVAGQPVQGRSGGGLFAADGFVIGVCNAADPSDNEGLYAAFASIHDQLDRAGIAPSFDSPLEAHDETLVAQNAAPPMPGRISLRSGDGNSSPPPQPYLPGSVRPLGPAATRASVAAAPPATNRPHGEPASLAPGTSQPLPQLSARERAALEEIQSALGRAEVICVIRPLDDPQAKTEIIVLDRASRGLVEQLTAARRADAAPQLTSLELTGEKMVPIRPHRAAALATQVSNRMPPELRQAQRNRQSPPQKEWRR